MFFSRITAAKDGPSETKGEGQALQCASRGLGVTEGGRKHPYPRRSRCSGQRNSAQTKQAGRFHVRELLLGLAGRLSQLEIQMTKLQEKAQGQVKQMVGQMIGDRQLEQEGRDQLRNVDQAANDARQDAATGDENQKQRPVQKSKAS